LSGSIAPSGKPYTGYEIWRKWEDVQEFERTLEREFARILYEKKKGLKAITKGFVYRAEKAASFESLPSGPDISTIAPDIHVYLPRLSKKQSLFRPTTALVEQRADEFQALMEALFDSNEWIIMELLERPFVRDWFGWWRRDKDSARKTLDVAGKSMLGLDNVHALTSHSSSGDLSIDSSPSSGSSRSSQVPVEATAGLHHSPSPLQSTNNRPQLSIDPTPPGLPQRQPLTPQVLSPAPIPGPPPALGPPPMRSPPPFQPTATRPLQTQPRVQRRGGDSMDFDSTMSNFPMPPPSPGMSDAKRAAISAFPLRKGSNPSLSPLPPPSMPLPLPPTEHPTVDLSKSDPNVGYPRSLLPISGPVPRRNATLPPPSLPPSQPLPDIPSELSAVSRRPNPFPVSRDMSNRRGRIFLSAPSTPKTSEDSNNQPELPEMGDALVPPSSSPSPQVSESPSSSTATISIAVSRRRSSSEASQATPQQPNPMRTSSPLPLGTAKCMSQQSLVPSHHSKDSFSSEIELPYLTPRLPLQFPKPNASKRSTSHFDSGVIDPFVEETKDSTPRHRPARPPPPLIPPTLRRSFSSGSARRRSSDSAMLSNVGKAGPPPSQPQHVVSDEDELDFGVVSGRLTEELIDSYFASPSTNFRPLKVKKKSGRPATADSANTGNRRQTSPYREPYSPGGRVSTQFLNRPPGQFHLPFSILTGGSLPPVVDILPEILTVKAVYAPADCIIVFRSPRNTPLHELQQRLKVKFFDAEHIALDWENGDVVLGYRSPSNSNSSFLSGGLQTPTSPRSPMMPMTPLSARRSGRSDSVASTSSSGDHSHVTFITTQEEWENAISACSDKLTLHILDPKQYQTA
jgi:hypothetical protein